MGIPGIKLIRDNAMNLIVVAALLVILASIYLHELQALLPIAALLFGLRIFLGSSDPNMRRLSGVLTFYFAASTLSNIAWYLVPSLITNDFINTNEYYYVTGIFWLIGYAAIAFTLFGLKNSRQWYIDRRLDIFITGFAVASFFLITLFVFLNLHWDSKHLIDIFILLSYLCFDAIILMLAFKLHGMNIKRELRALVNAIIIYFAINTISDLLFECRWLFKLSSLISLTVGGFEMSLNIRNTTDLIYNASLLLMISVLFVYTLDPFKSRALDEARRRLKDTQLFVDDLIAKSPDATCIFDRDGRLVLVNDPFLQFFGLKRKDMDRSINLFSHMGHIIGKHAEYLPVMKVKEGETIILPKLKVTMRRSRKGDFYIFLKIFPTYSTDGQIANYVLIIDDITDRIRLEDDLIKAYGSLKEEYRRKTDFTNAAAHELRTPLTPIIGYTDILKSEVKDEQQLKYLEIIERNALRQKTMVNRMLELASLDAGMAHANYSEFDVRPLAAEIADNYRTVNGNIHVEVPAGLGIKSDPEVIRHVLDNLVSNAVKYSETDREIEIKAVEDGEFYRFSVKDQGAGIPEEEWGRIFERFYIVGGDKDNRTSNRVGLGLALVKAYVSLIGGTVWLESQPGDGSTFYFSVPRVPPSGPANV